ncbi:MAG: right-handed parallel beta-helix repeat-containing protein [Candidatus Binatia bacterium]
MTVRGFDLVIALVAVVLGAGVASAHKERPIASPVRPGPVPALGRKAVRTLVVCKASSKPTQAQLAAIRQDLPTATGAAFALAKAKLVAWKRNAKLVRKCRYEHIQAAVNDATDDTCIKVLPGVYREEPSRSAPTTGSGDLPDGSYSYDYHVAHPNDANLIAILGKKNITLEGTGADPRDVLIDGGFVKDVPLRADRADGIIIRNLWARDGNEHCIYVVETDGYVFDRTVGSFCKEYALFSFASDNGLYQDCEAEGGGDSGIYIGGDPDTSGVGRFAAEVRRCKMHHNALGFSGTQGTSIWMHDNDVYDNAIGLSFDSENDHPNFPERKSLIEGNLLHDNNFEIYDATSDVPPGGPAYNFFRYPVGTGMWIVGGDDNTIRGNYIYNNKRFGTVLASNPLEVPLPANINGNQTYGNFVGIDATGAPAPNHTAFPPGGDFAEGGTDFFWDGSGNDNCWGLQDPSSGPVTHGPATAPGPCPSANMGGAFGRIEALALLLSCSLAPDPMNPGQFVTADQIYPCPFGHANLAPYQSRDEAECGNGSVDVGEECDAGYGGGPSAAETCRTLGRGPGALLCNARCDFDTSDCAAGTCGRYANATVRLRRLGAPSGDDRVSVKLTAVEFTGTTFDPAADGLAITVRNGSGLLYQGDIPAASPNWSTPTPGAWVYKDVSQANDGIETVEVRANGLVSAKIRRASITGAIGSDTVSVTVRVGDDCWSGEESCASSGTALKCRKDARP